MREIIELNEALVRLLDAVGNLTRRLSLRATHSPLCTADDLAVVVRCNRCGQIVEPEAIIDALIDDNELMELLGKCATVISFCRFVGWQPAEEAYPGIAQLAREVLDRLSSLLKQDRGLSTS